MKAWDVESARLWLIEPQQELLCDWVEIPQSLVMYSGPVQAESEVIAWDGESELAVEGKIPLTRHRINDVFPAMRERDVRGILSDFLGSLPGVRDPLDLPDSCRWENSAIRLGYGEYWGFMLTPRQGARIRNDLSKGPVRVRAEIRSRVYAGHFCSVTGRISGATKPDEEIVLVTHLYEPGANDNASGVGCALEIARALVDAIDSGTIARPQRSVRFLFTWEGYGLLAWMEKHSARTAQRLAGLNIDEMGVDQHKGRSVLHLFMPPAANPSCVGPLLEHLCRQILSPQIRWRAVADRAEIINDTVTSDPHIDIPTPCLIQYPSRHYHASSDAIETLSEESMNRVGQVAATYLNMLANADEAEAEWIAEITRAYHERELHEIDLKVRTGSWLFSAERTFEFHQERFQMAIDSIRRFGLAESAGSDIKNRLLGSLRACVDRWKPSLAKRCQTKHRQAEARGLGPRILRRASFGAPKAWGSFELSPAAEAEYRRTLYDNNLDLLFHRICYWCDGRRTLSDIVRRLEFEMEELMQDTAISRTSSGAAIDVSPASVNFQAVEYVVEKLETAGYLE